MDWINFCDHTLIRWLARQPASTSLHVSDFPLRDVYELRPLFPSLLRAAGFDTLVVADAFRTPAACTWMGPGDQTIVVLLGQSDAESRRALAWRDADALPSLRDWISQNQVGEKAPPPPCLDLRARQLEHDIILAEMLVAGADRAESVALHDKIAKAWDELLSIMTGPAAEGEARDRAEQRIHKLTDKCIERASTSWITPLSTMNMQRPVALIRSGPSAPFGVLMHPDEELFAAKQLPSLGVRVVDRAKSPGFVAVSSDDLTLSNGIITVTFDPMGNIESFTRVGTGDATHDAPLGDEPPFCTFLIEEGDDGEFIEPDEAEISGNDFPLRAGLRFERTLRGEPLDVITFILDAGSSRLNVTYGAAWQRQDAELHLALSPNLATAGPSEKITRERWHWLDGQAFIELSAGARGMLLAAETPHRLRFREGSLYVHLVSLRESHGDVTRSFSVGLHDGDAPAARASLETVGAMELLVDLNPDEEGSAGEDWAPLTVSASGGARLSTTLACGTEPGSIQLHLLECEGTAGEVRVQWHVPVTDVTPINLRGEPVTNPSFSHTGSVTRAGIGAMGLMTISAKRL